ncbi:sensor histidine kinase [Elusimicrobiota bacterium]
MKRILMVEDNADQRNLIRQVFKISSPHFELEEAVTGTEAMVKIMASDYDLILLDHRLPGKTGLEVLENIRKEGSQTPVIMMTADTNARTTVEAMRLGISDFILKEGPFQMNLPAAVQRVFEKIDMKKALKKAQAESQFQSAKLANLGKILSEVLHEVRNPLSIISTSLESLRDAKDKEKALDRVLDLMLRNVDRARQLINSLLDFSRPTEYKYQKADLLAIVSELVGHLRLKCDRQKISLDVDSTPGLPKVWADVQHIKGSFLNLFINAVEAMPDGGTLSVALSDEPAKESVRVEISDTGVGIRPEDRKHLFERYFTTKDSGTGLGLIITNEVLTRHKGSIQVNSAPGKGTTFTILLPVNHRP